MLSRTAQGVTRTISFCLLVSMLCGCSVTDPNPMKPSTTRRQHFTGIDLPLQILPSIAGTYTNSPRRIPVSMEINNDGTWTATVADGHPFLTCKDSLLALPIVMGFSGSIDISDTTAFVTDDWEDLSVPELPKWGLFQATYHQTFAVVDTVIGPVISVSYAMMVTGSCQGGRRKKAWLLSGETNEKMQYVWERYLRGRTEEL